jgi:hypothetical protein
MGIIPFFTCHAYHPCTGSKPLGIYGDPLNHPQALAADQLVQHTREIMEFLQDKIAWAQGSYEYYANQQCQPHPYYNIRDLVYVNTCHFNLQQNSNSLAPKNLGPWPIKHVINGKAYKVKIPIHMLNAGITPIFHPWKLHLASNNPLPGQVADPEPPVIVTDPGNPEAHEEWDVREIVNCHVYHNHH